MTRDELDLHHARARRARAAAAMADDPVERVRLQEEAERALRVADEADRQWQAIRQAADAEESRLRAERDEAASRREARRRYLATALPGACRIVEQRRSMLDSARRAVVDAEHDLRTAEAALETLQREAKFATERDSVA